MKKATSSFFFLLLFLHGISQKDSAEVLFAFRITDYTVQLNDSITLVQVILPEVLPVSVKNNQIGILKHRYKSNTESDTSLIGWGRCELIKSNYYYFSIHKYHNVEPVQGDLLYTKCKTPVYYQSPLYDLNRHGISLTKVDETQFCHSIDLFSLNPQKENALLDSMIADLRFTGKAMKGQMPEQNQLIKGGLYDGKKLFDAMAQAERKELEEFLKYIIARPANYAGNVWKLSEIYATWMINKTPQVIEK